MRIDPTTPFLSEDQFHPSAVGYAIWADVIFEALIALPSAVKPPVQASLQTSGA
jgi:lysophospholipase L1-like esterase